MPQGFMESILHIHMVYTAFLVETKYILEGTNMLEFGLVLKSNVTRLVLFELLMIYIFLK